MDDAGFIIASYVLTLGAVGAYLLALVRRARRTGKNASSEELPWT